MMILSRQNIRYKIRKYLKYPLISGVVVLLAFLREMTIAANYGLGAELDVFAIVLTLYVFFGVQTGTSFEHVFVSEMAHKKADDIARMLSVVLVIIGTVYVALMLLVYMFSSNYLNLVYPYLTENQLNLANELVAVFLVVILATVLVGVFKGNLYIKEKFSIGMLGGSFVSFFTIFSVLLFSETYGIMPLAYGYLIGSIVFAFVLFLMVRRVYSFRFELSLSDIKKSGYIWKALFLLIVGNIFFQLSFTAQRSIASGLEEGAVSALYYSMAIVQVMLAFFVAPLTTILFPKLKRQFHDNKVAGFYMLKRYLLFFFVFGLIASIVIYVLSEMIVELAFVRGAFTMEDAYRTASFLAILVFLLPFFSISLLVRYGYYSLNNYHAPIIAHLITWLVLILTAPYFLREYSEIGLAYSIVLSVAISSFILITVLLWRNKNEKV